MSGGLSSAGTQKRESQETTDSLQADKKGHSPTKFRKWGKASSASVRYGGLTGRLLDDRVFEDYVDQDGAWLSLFDVADKLKEKPLLSRHELNDRNQVDTRAKYKQTVLTMGYKPRSRNEMVVIPKQKGSNEYYVLSGAHLVEAIYDAHKDHPDNDQVKASIRGGVKASILDPRTPEDILIHYKEDGNSLNHMGGQVPFIEVMADCPRIQQKWKDHRRAAAEAASDEDEGPEGEGDGGASKEKKKFDNKKYEADYTLWLNTNYPGYFPGGFNHFDMCRRCSNKLKEQPDLAKELREYCDEHCVYSDPKLVSADVWYLLDKLMAKLEAHGLWDMFLSIFKYCIPTNDGHPWLVRERKDWGKVLSLFIPMSTGAKNPGDKGKVAKLAEKAALKKAFQLKNLSKKQAAQAAAKGGKKIKKKGKAKAASGKAQKFAGDAFAHYDASGNKGQEVVVLEEIQGTIEYAVDDILNDAHLNQDYMWMCTDLGIIWTLQGGTVQVPPLADQRKKIEECSDQAKKQKLEKQLHKTSWSGLKKHIVMLIREFHKFAPKKDMDDMFGPTAEVLEDPEGAPNVVLSESALPKAINKNMLKEAVGMVSQESLKIYKNFFTQNKLENVSWNIAAISPAVFKVRHPALQTMSATLLQLAMGADDVPSADVTSIIDMVGTAVFRSLPEDMVHFMSRLRDSCGGDESCYTQLASSGAAVLEQALEIWPTLSDLNLAVDLRGIFTSVLLQEVPDIIAVKLDGSSASTGTGASVIAESQVLNDFIKAKRAVARFADVACQVESKAVDKAAWVAVWAKLVTEAAQNPLIKVPKTRVELREWAQELTAKLEQQKKEDVGAQAILLGWDSTKGGVKAATKKYIIQFIVEKSTAAEKKRQEDADDSTRLKLLELLGQGPQPSTGAPATDAHVPTPEQKDQKDDSPKVDSSMFVPVKVAPNAPEHDVRALADTCTHELMKLRHYDEGVNLIKHRTYERAEGTIVSSKMYCDFPSGTSTKLKLHFVGKVVLLRYGVQPSSKSAIKLGTVKIPETTGAVYAIWATPTPAMMKSTDAEFVTAWGVSKVLENKKKVSMKITYTHIQIPACTDGYNTPATKLSVPYLEVNSAIFFEKTGTTDEAADSQIEKDGNGKWPYTELSRPEFPEEADARAASAAVADSKKRRLKLGDSDENHADELLKFSRRAAS